MAKNKAYYDKSPILKELGWNCVFHTSDGNSESAHWAPSESDGPVSDIYVFESFHIASGSSVIIVWADNYAEAKQARDIANIPSFNVSTKEELAVILKCLL